MRSNCNLILALVVSALLGGCSGFQGFRDDLCGNPRYYSYSDRERPLALMPAFPRKCLGNDQLVMEFGQCAMTGGSCYQLIDGAWCATTSLEQCPVGTAPIALEATCPDGAQCWMHESNLRCRSV